MFLVAGNNLFGQWFVSSPILHTFTNITVENKDNFNLSHSNLLKINWGYNIFKFKNHLYISGVWKGKDYQLELLTLAGISKINDSPSNIIVSGNDYNLIIANVVTHMLWIMDLETADVKEIKLLIETPIGNHEEHKKIKLNNDIIKIVATNNTYMFLLKDGSVYSGLPPSLVDTTNCLGTVCDIESGHVHNILLTDTGSIYTWGEGRRLQLGHGDLENLDVPTEVKALAGLKIKKIRAGGWHSLALSEGGDLYSWGWNNTGQLGLTSEYENQGVPTLVNIYDDNGQEVHINVKDIACGSNHSAILLDNHSLWTTGCNKYGQLGFSPNEHSSVKPFRKTFLCDKISSVICGPWTTVIYSGM